MNAPAPPSSPLRLELRPASGRPAPFPAPLRPAALVEGPPLAWTATDRPGLWRTRIELGAVAADRLVVPSVLPGAVALRAWSWAFEGAGTRIPLAPIPATADLDVLPEAPKARVGRPAEDSALWGGLDCIETRVDLDAVHLDLVVATDGPAPDAAVLITDRARHIEVADRGATAPALHVPAHSQKIREARIADHVCSPVSVAMVLGAGGAPVDVEAFARRCEHPHFDRLFGLWPLNLIRARDAGSSGVVRLFDDVDEIAAILRAGAPIVASIRFEARGLGGAPLTRTGGHLVVLRGLDADVAHVHDPAAPDDASVERRYDRRQFLEAWLADRGVGYVLWPDLAETP